MAEPIMRFIKIPLSRFSLSVLFLAAFLSWAHAAEITVFAAASLSDSLKELAPRFKSGSGHTLRFCFGASGALARQIREGAPADVILSADELRVDQLEKAGLLRPGSRRTVLANLLVLVVDASGPASVASLQELSKPEIRRIVMGDPATVPVGTYTREYLQKLGLWKGLTDKLVPVDNVRAALAAVEAGNAEAGFVYRTDALISRKVRIAVEVPRGEGPSITYPAAVLREALQGEAAMAFVEYLSSPEAQSVFVKHGFLPVQ